MQVKQLREHIIHPARGGIQIGMTTDDMYPRLHSGMRKFFCRTIRTQAFQRMKDSRMMGDDKFGLASLCLGQQGRGRVQGKENRGDPTVRVADEQTDIIPGLSEIKRGYPLKNIKYILNFYHNKKKKRHSP